MWDDNRGVLSSNDNRGRVFSSDKHIGGLIFFCSKSIFPAPNSGENGRILPYVSDFFFEICKNADPPTPVSSDDPRCHPTTIVRPPHTHPMLSSRKIVK